MCQETEGCNVFTYRLDNKDCDLKTSDAGRETDVGAISGTKYCKGRYVYNFMVFILVFWLVNITIHKCVVHILSFVSRFKFCQDAKCFMYRAFCVCCKFDVVRMSRTVHQS